MEKIIIKNIGALKNVEFDINRINVFMGPQSSGKSTISKILCHCQWVEKNCFMNEKELEYYKKDGVFYDSLVEYHKLEGYFNKNASIKYFGDYLTISYSHNTKKTTIVVKKEVSFSYPKICYIPSERNFVAGVSNFSKYNEGNNVLLYFGYDWSDAKKNIKKLDISKLLNREVIYENLKDEDFIFDNGSKIRLVNASSGVQSVLPLFQTILYMLSNIFNSTRVLSPSKSLVRNDLFSWLAEFHNVVAKNDNIIKNSKQDVIKLITIFNSINDYGVKSVSTLADLSKVELLSNIINASINIDDLFSYKYSQLFIEEPEQNLFPETQQEFVYWLMDKLLNNNRNHSAVITTHSPFILFSLNNCMMGGLVKALIPEDEKNKFPSKLGWINPKLVSVFEIHDGEIKSIQDEDGIIEDNYLNKAYKKNSEEYLSLLNYYEDEE